MNIKTRQITLTAIFMALGILFPMLFHGLGIGSIFLPMFWPLAFGAFFLPIGYAILLALMTPVLSMMLTGMPPIPILYLMIAELMALTGIIVWLLKKRLGIFWTLLIALTLSRVILFMSATLFGEFLGLPQKITGIAMVLNGLPGTLLMLVFIPVLLKRFLNQPVYTMRSHA